MKRIITVLICIAAFLTLPSWKMQTNEQTEELPSKSRYAKDHFIVKLKKINNIFAASYPGKLYTSSLYEAKIYEMCGAENITVQKIKRLYPEDKKHNNALYNKYELETYYVIYINESEDIKGLSTILTENTDVDFAEPDFIGESAGVKGSEKPNDEFFRKQWALDNDGRIKTTGGRTGKPGADMNVLNAWTVATGSEDVIVAILDSGAKVDHPDLNARIWINSEETKNGRDDDGNGYIDDIYGYNFAYDNPNVKDDGGHGTNISGTVGAHTNNSIGYAGIDQKCKLMICKNLDDENLGEYSWWSASLYYAANNGARVINMSEGGYDYSKTLENAISYAYDAGCLIVASMMNKNNSDTYYPASFKNVMAVGATDTDDSRCREFTWGGGSNWGKHISVTAPGNRIYGLDYKDNFNYDVYWSGTSQATAYVSGIASILIGQNPSRTNKEIKEIITKTAVDQCGDPREDKQGWDQYYGYGRVDLYEALSYGKSPSGKKERRVFEKTDEDTDTEMDKTDNEAKNSTRAKANDPDKKDRERKDDNDRARKPKPDKDR
jgi:subtilisin family serine protease